MLIKSFLKSAALATFLTQANPVYALDLDAMSQEEKRQFGEQVREYLLENPEVLAEAIGILQERQQIAEQQQDVALISANIDNIQNDGFSWVGGNPEGDITLVEFLDYKCGYCRKAHSEVAELVKTDGNIRLVVKEYPILSEDSMTLSRVAVATLQSLGPDAYKKIYDLLIAHNGPVNDQAISFIANKAGLDAVTILQAMKAPSVDEQIEKTRQLGQTLQVSGTPTFIFNDQIIRGYVPLDDMKQVVADLRAQTE